MAEPVVYLGTSTDRDLICSSPCEAFYDVGGDIKHCIAYANQTISGNIGEILPSNFDGTCVTSQNCQDYINGTSTGDNCATECMLSGQKSNLYCGENVLQFPLTVNNTLYDVYFGITDRFGTDLPGTTGDMSTLSGSTKDITTRSMTNLPNLTEPMTTGPGTATPSLTERMTTGDLLTGDTSVGDLFTEDTTIRDLFTGDSTTGDMSTRNSSIWDMLTGNSTTANKFTGNNTIWDMLTGNSTTGDMLTVNSTTGDTMIADSTTGMMSSTRSPKMISELLTSPVLSSLSTDMQDIDNITETVTEVDTYTVLLQNYTTQMPMTATDVMTVNNGGMNIYAEVWGPILGAFLLCIILVTAIWGRRRYNSRKRMVVSDPIMEYVTAPDQVPVGTQTQVLASGHDSPDRADVGRSARPYTFTNEAYEPGDIRDEGTV